MVEARHIRMGSRGFSRTQTRVAPRQRRANSRGTEASVLFTGLVVCLMCLALLVTARQAEVARVGYAIGSLKKELASLQSEYQRLDVEVASLQSLNRVELAAKEMGMTRPAEVRLVYADVPAIQPAATVAVAETGLRYYLSQVSAAIARIASGVMGAEAKTLK